MTFSLSVWKKTRHYLRENWGAVLIIAFMVLLLASATQLSLGLNDAANTTAIYAFYSLVLGVALQIASYLKYGEASQEEIPEVPQKELPEVVKPSSPPRALPASWWKVLAISVVAITLLGSGVTIYFVSSTPPVLPHPTHPQLSVTLSFKTVLPEPNGTTVISFSMISSGGVFPYNYTALWSDGVTQTSANGFFTRTFANQTIPQHAYVFVTSSDLQRVVYTVDFNQSTTTIQSTTTTSRCPRGNCG